MRRLIFWQLSVTMCAWALQAPSALTVVSATNKQVKLTWTAGDAAQCTVERRALNAKEYSALGTAASSYTDTAFDPFTAYVYRVRLANGAGTSNEVTVGPPPMGYSRVVATPDGRQKAPQYGYEPTMVLDESGDPVLGYLVVDPTETNDFNKNELWFVRWDRAHYRWTAPVKVGVIGAVEDSFANNLPFRLAVDASNGAMAIAYEDRSVQGTFQISIADSTDSGATWRKRKVTSDSQNTYAVPALVMAGGKVHLSFFHDNDGIRYMTGALADDPSKWKSELAPKMSFTDYRQVSDVALDGSGNPGMAYMAVDDHGHHEIFYRPGGSPVVANNSEQGPGDFWGLRLAFAGTNPRIAFAGQADDKFFDGYDRTVWVLSSNDGGKTWGARTNVVSDGQTALSSPVDLAFDAAGHGALAIDTNGGSEGGIVCGFPKLALSNGTAWKTCGITTKIRSRASAPSVRYAANGTLYVAYQAPDYPDEKTDAFQPAGVYFWRGPSGFTLPGKR